MLRNLEKRIIDLDAQASVVQQIHISFEGNKTILYTPNNGVKIYEPSPTGCNFHSSNDRVRLVCGQYGSGKTTMCIQDIPRRAAQMPAWFNGTIRKSKWAIIRNTSGELVTTTLQSWLMWFGDLGMITKRQKPVLTYEHAFNDEHGRIEIELIFLALDRDDDIRKLKSLEITGCYFNELSEIPKAAFDHITSRLRYPSQDFCPEEYWSGIIADTNPPDNDHWLYKTFEEQSLPGFRIFKQPPGLLMDTDGKLLQREDGRYIDNPDHDNYKHLKNKDYYSDAAIGKDMEYIKVYCLGQYGSLRTGKVVYPDYNDDLHSMSDLQPIPGLPLYFGQDFGLTPAAVIVQFTPRGQLLILREYLSEDMSVNTFAENILIPGIKRDFPGYKLEIGDADPAGDARNQAFDELTCIGVMRSLGLNVVAADTNNLEPRLNAVRFFLTRMVDGKPSLLVSREHCPTIRKGFIKDYYFRKIRAAGEERYHIEPVKNSCSHPHDALQYVALRFAGSHVQAMQDKPKNNNDFLPVFNWSN